MAQSSPFVPFFATLTKTPHQKMKPLAWSAQLTNTELKRPLFFCHESWSVVNYWIWYYEHSWYFMIVHELLTTSISCSKSSTHSPYKNTSESLPVISPWFDLASELVSEANRIRSHNWKDDEAPGTGGKIRSFLRNQQKLLQRLQNRGNKKRLLDFN